LHSPTRDAAGEARCLPCAHNHPGPCFSARTRVGRGAAKRRLSCSGARCSSANVAPGAQQLHRSIVPFKGGLTDRSAVRLSDRKIVYGRRFRRTRGEWRGKIAVSPPQRFLGMQRACFRAEPRLSVARVRFYDLIMGQVVSCFEGTLLCSSRLPLLDVFAGGLRSITQSTFVMYHFASERGVESLSLWALHFISITSDRRRAPGDGVQAPDRFSCERSGRLGKRFFVSDWICKSICDGLFRWPKFKCKCMYVVGCREKSIAY
jgi:hypothetical protein